MYTTPTKIHTEGRIRTAKAQIHPAISQPAAAPVRCNFGLSLPKLSPAIPASFMVQENAIESSLTLLTFLDAGLVAESDVPEKWEANDSIIKQSLDRWTAKQSDKLQLFDMKVIYSERLDDLISDYDIEQEQLIKVCDADPEKEIISFGIYADSWDEVVIGKKMELLEKAVPGFGKTVIGHLSKATSSTTMYCITPTELLGICQHLYWYGDEDESTLLEEMMSEMDGEELEAEKENIIKKSDLYANMPEWSVECGTPMSVEEIRKLTNHKDKFVAEVAKALLPIVENCGKDEMKHSVPIMENHCSPALLIRWSKKDMTTQLYDDYYQYLMNGECSNDIHRYFISNQDPDQLQDTFSCMEKYIDATSQVDKLLCLLKED